MSKQITVFVFCLLFATACMHESASSPFAPAPQWNHEWSRGAVFYEVFVRSFQDSNGDGVGDLKGLISRLDYLNDGNPATNQDLGVNAIWLMPVFASPSYHGYDVTNYRLINPDYGTQQDFTTLLTEAHRRGMKVIVDFVMNHTSSDNPWFVDSASSAASAKRNWYVWSATNPGWTPPWGGNNPTWHPKNGSYYYGVFWEGMPDLNYRNEAVRKEMSSIAAYWLKLGMDGFRLDAARHLIEDGAGQAQVDTPETHAYWKSFSTFIRATHPESVLVGENWTETPNIAKYYGSTQQVSGGDELPMNFNFPMSSAIVSSVQSGNAAAIVNKLAEMQQLYPAGVIDAPFLTNHDNVRIATQLQNNTDQLRSAASILLTLPGAPFLYYGEELGLRNGPTDGDESKRTPMPWSNTTAGGFTTGTPWFPLAPGIDTANVELETTDADSLLSHYRGLIHARNQSAALRQGDLQVLSSMSTDSSILAFLRKTPTETAFVAINIGGNFGSAGPFAINGLTAKKLYSDGSVGQPSVTSGQWTVALPPHSSGIWLIK